MPRIQPVRIQEHGRVREMRMADSALTQTMRRQLIADLNRVVDAFNLHTHPSLGKVNYIRRKFAEPEESASTRDFLRYLESAVRDLAGAISRHEHHGTDPLPRGEITRSSANINEVNPIYSGQDIPEMQAYHQTLTDIRVLQSNVIRHSH